MTIQSTLSAAQERAWQERKNLHWSRNDTQRWLDDRADAVKQFFAHVIGRPIPPKVRYPGQWLYNALPKNFGFTHAQLADLSTEEREHAPLKAVLPLECLPMLANEQPTHRGRRVCPAGANGTRKKAVR